MATNLYFNNVGSHTEQELINSLTSEVIQIHGMDVFYLPRTLIKEDLIISAHDVSDGGLFITLLESSMANNLGFSINSDDNIRKDAFLFGESPSRVVVSIDNCNKKAFETLLSKTKTSFHQIGTVTEGDLLVDGELFGNVSDYKQKFDTSLTKKMS